MTTYAPPANKLHTDDHAGDQVVRVPDRVLFVVRGVWIMLAVITIVAVAAAIPLRYQQYSSACSSESCYILQLTPLEVDALHSGNFSLPTYGIYAGTLEVIRTLAFVMVGLVIFWRKSGEWVAVLVSLWLITFGTADLLTALKHPIWVQLSGYLDDIGWVFLLPLFLFLFPDGQFVPRWTQWFVIVAAGVIILVTTLGLLLINLPYQQAAFVFWLSIQLTGIGSQIYRYRRISDPLQRQQTRWVVYGLVMVVVVIVINILLQAIVPAADQPGETKLLRKLIEVTFVNLAFLIIPVTIGISILRYRLWDIDIIISRTLIYGSLTTFVIGLYVIIVGSMGMLFHSSGNLLFSLLATGVIAVLFQPLRGKLQHAVNRMMFGERDDPVAVLSRLGQRLETTLTPDSLLPGMVEMVGQALKLPYVAIELHSGEGKETVATYGDQVSEVVHLPLAYQAERIGEFVVAPRGPGESFDVQDRRLLANIAHQAGIVVHMMRLTGELQQSREHLITAREEERRRLRRDLHDGLGPALATLSLKAEAARDLISENPDKSMALMDEVISGTQAAINSIRQVVYALRPPALDDLGLVEALREQALQYSVNGLTIFLKAPIPPPVLPAAIEVALYRIVQEALTNVVRHANATTCTVRLEIDDAVRLEICDDGRGIPWSRPSGVGLNSIRERTAELGGRCQIESTPGTGTRLNILLPGRSGEHHGNH